MYNSIIKFMNEDDQKHVFTVSELNREVGQLLASNFGVIWIEGEISNYMKSAAGHSYFSLKDEKSNIRCAMFRQQSASISFSMKDGQKIIARAKVGLYQARGDYQLIIEYAEEAGEGLLRQQFETLKKKLAAEGLFEPSKKKALPHIPTYIGLITSSSGAAIQDIFNTINRRYNDCNLIVYPTLVQGQSATKQICNAIRIANERLDCNVLIIARGGGSLEDLWCFNEESVAREIYNSTLPIISGIGHETDLTIADMVSDYRAPTPTGAAEIVLPEKQDIIDDLKDLTKQMYQSISYAMLGIKNQLIQKDSNLQQKHPASQLQQFNQRLDQLSQSMSFISKNYLEQLKNHLNQRITEIQSMNPVKNIHDLSNQLEGIKTNLLNSIQYNKNIKEQSLSIALAKLDGASPLHALSRGYAFVSDSKTKKSIKSVADISIGAVVQTQLQDGIFESKVSDLKKNKK